MPLPTPMTLGEIRTEVLTRVGAASVGNTGSRWHAKVDSFIRSATRQLYLESPWIALAKEVDIDLSADVSDYDWPDDSEVGSIDTAVIVSDSGNEYPLDFGSRTNERNTSANSSSGRPVLLDYIDENLRLVPAPSSSYVTLRLRYRAAPNAMVEDNSEIVVEGELVIMQVVMAFKRDQGLPVSQDDRAEFERYLMRVRASQSTGEGFVIGGHRAGRTYGQKRNRVSRGRSIGDGAAYTDDWAPY